MRINILSISMDKVNVFLLCLFFSLFFTSGSDGAKLDFYPSKTLTIGAPKLTLNCTIDPTFNMLYITTLAIRKREYNPSVLLTYAELSFGRTKPVYGSGISTSRYHASGQVIRDDLPSSYLQLEVTDPNCNDEGTYECYNSGSNNQGAVKTPSSGDNVIIRDAPVFGNLTMAVLPEQQIYLVNSVMNIVCSGNVGYKQQDWTWQWRNDTDQTWLPYPDAYNITYEDITPPDGRCSYVSRSTLKYLVEDRENGIQFRCMVGDLEQFSFNLTVYSTTTVVNPTLGTTTVPQPGVVNPTLGTTTVPQPGVNPTLGTTTVPQPGGGGGDDNSDLEVVGIAVGLVLVVIIVLVGVLLYFTIWKKRKLKVTDQEYDIGTSKLPVISNGVPPTSTKM
ncbi:uncharacterized protein LOC126829939 isoform X2 [Patella vulgata]|uniref:uncharacterized protein LOC126829939 isoform X2 n=1 Tax=Patella vulgata TaxID=6465 RepID=UPI0024A7CFFE|nr:uncharacterized protein LOC126829939 isoform X2 [Patella vulgata]